MSKRLVDADAILKVLEGYTFTSEQDYEDVVDAINSAKIETLEVNEGTSDGYHTFKELYEHRHRLFIALMHSEQALDIITSNPITCPWKSKKHFDGSEMEGWFIAGMRNYQKETVTYHLPIRLWDDTKVTQKEFAPVWDGHTSKDVLERLTHF